MAKDKYSNPATFINADKTLISVKDIRNVPMIYKKLGNFVGTPKDSYATAYKNKGFILEVKEGKKVDIREINTLIYFAELDLVRETNRRVDLSKALKSGTPTEIEESKLRYGVAVLLNRESISAQRFEDDVINRFEFYVSKNPDKPAEIKAYENQVRQEIDSLNKAFKILENVGIATASEKGTLYLKDWNTFKKVEMIQIVDSDYIDITEATFVKAMAVSESKKAISDATYGVHKNNAEEKDAPEQKNQDATTETAPTEEAPASKKRASSKSSK